MMLDQDSNEALERAQDRPVKHDRPVPLPILADVGRIEPLGKDAVRLNCADLPGAADRISEVEFQLGCIESALAGQFFPAIFLGRAARRLDGLAKLRFRLVPVLVATEALIRTKRELDRIFVEPK